MHADTHTCTHIYILGEMEKKEQCGSRLTGRQSCCLQQSPLELLEAGTWLRAAEGWAWCWGVKVKATVVEGGVPSLVGCSHPREVAGGSWRGCQAQASAATAGSPPRGEACPAAEAPSPPCKIGTDSKAPKVGKGAPAG